MQGSRVEGSRSNWKQAVRKNNPPASKIFGENGDLPNKFSPAKFNIMDTNSKSLIRNRANNYSTDEIQLEESRERSRSKEPELRKGQAANAPRSSKYGSEIQGLRRGVDSQKSIDFQIKRNINVQATDIDIVKELKQQFLRFKEKILKELRKQEEELKNAIQQIQEKMNSLSNCVESPIHFKSSPIHSKINEIFVPQMQSYQSPISKYLQTANKQIFSRIQSVPQKINKGDRNVIASESVNPKIKQRMQRMQELINNIKLDLYNPETNNSNRNGKNQMI